MNIQRYLSPSITEGTFATLRSSLEMFRKSLRQGSVRRAVYRRTRDELIMLSGRELYDIGIPRAHIRRAAREESRKVQQHG